METNGSRFNQRSEHKSIVNEEELIILGGKFNGIFEGFDFFNIQIFDAVSKKMTLKITEIEERKEKKQKYVVLKKPKFV